MSKRRDLNDTERAGLLKAYDDLPAKTKQREDAKKLGISQSFLSKLLKSRDVIENIWHQNKCMALFVYCDKVSIVVPKTLNYIINMNILLHLSLKTIRSKPQLMNFS